MRIRPNVALSFAAALAWGALLSPPARAAGSKSNSTDTITDDLAWGTAGSVQAGGGGRTLDGGLSQVAANIVQSTAGSTVEAGFFSAMATSPVSGQILPVSTSTISASWTNAASPNPAGTLYTLQASTAPNFSGTILSTAVYAFAASIGGLNANSTYYLQLQTSYTDDAEPGYFALGSTLTLPNSNPPTSAITGPAAGFVNSLASISGTAQAYSGATVSSVTVSIQNLNNGKYWNGSSFASSSAAFALASVSTAAAAWSYVSVSLSTNLINGTSYQIQSLATDSNALTQSAAAVIDFTYDTTIPTLAIIAPANGSSLSSLPAISGTAADALSGISQTSVQISSSPSYGSCWNGFAWGGCPSYLVASGTTAWSYTALPALLVGTTYQIQAKTLDFAGNVSSATTNSFVYTGTGTGCSVSTTVVAGVNTITSAVNSAGPSLSGNLCVVVNGGLYIEQVNVRNIATNGYQILISSGTGGTVSINPPYGSTAAFVIANASVSVSGINIVSTNTITYGVLISSAYVQISSVNVQDAGGLITTAGIAASSWTTVSYASVTVGGANASGIWLPGSIMTSVSYSFAQGNGTTAPALWLNGASSNTISNVYTKYLTGFGSVLDNNSNNNTISQSNMTGASVNGIALRISSSAYNTITQSVISLPSFGVAAQFDGNARYNTIIQSTMTDTSTAGNALATIAGCSSNTITQSYMSNTTGGAVALGGSYNIVSQSTMTANGANGDAAAMTGSFNTITNSYAANPLGIGIVINSVGESFDTISQSTVTSNNASYPAIWLQGASSNTLSGDYIQGSTAAVWVQTSTSTLINGSMLVAISTAGVALQMSGSVNLTLSSSSLSASSGGAGLSLGAGNSGPLVFATDAITGARYGALIAAQSAGAGVSINAMNFSGLASGATAMQFTGGTFVSTFTGVSFDSSVAVNVNAVALSSGSSITMAAPLGPRSGSSFSTDPNHYVHWPSTITAPLVGILSPIPQANDRETPASLSTIAGTSFDPVANDVVLVQLRVRNETGPLYWDPTTNNFDLPAALSESAWFNAVSTNQYVNWTSTANNISYAPLDGSTFTVVARSLNSSGAYSTIYSSNSFVYDSLAPQTGVTVPANSTNTSTLSSIMGTTQDYPIVNPGAVPVVNIRLERLSDGKFWTGTTGAGVWVGSLATMGAVQGVVVGSSSWSVGAANLPAPNNLPSGLQSGDSYYITASGTDNADGGGNTEAWNSPRGSTFTFVASSAPTSAVTGPPAGFVNSLPGISGTAQAYNGATVSSVTVAVQNLASGLYWDGASSFSSASSVFILASLSTSSVVWSYVNVALSTALINGTSYQIQSQATDSFGQAQPVPAATGFVFDNQPPATAILNPLSGTIRNSVPAVNGTGFDNVLLSTVQLSIQDVATGNCYRTSSSTFASGCPAWFPAQGSPAAWSFTFPSQPWTQAHQYVILSSGTDAAQNAQVALSSAGFLFDVVAPTVTVTVPNLFLNPAQTAFVGTSTETTSGLSSLQFALTSSTGPGSWLTSLGGTFTSSAPVFFATTTYTVGIPDNWTWSYATTLTDGQNYLLRALSTDKAANARTQNVSFLYDATPAVATITFPTNGSVLSSTPIITGASYDAPGPGGFASGVSTVAVSIMNRTTGHCYVAGGGFVSACPNFNPAAGSPAAWTFAPSPNPFVTGVSYLITTQGTDNAGNVQGVYAVGASSNTFTYDTAIPQVGVTSPIPQAGDREAPAALAVLAGTAYDISGSLALVQLRVRNETGPLYWDPATNNFDLPPAQSESAWFNAVSTDQYVNWTSTANNISYAPLNGSTFTVVARSLNSAGTYSNVYSSNSFVYDSLAPQTGVTSPANGAYVNVLALSGTAADLPANNPGSVASLQLRLERLSDGYYWNGASAWVPTATMGAAQGVSVFSSSWNVAGANLPSGANLLSGASYYVTTSGTDNADGGGNTEAFGGPRGSTFTYDNIPPGISIELPVSGAVYASLPTVSGTSGDNIAVATVTLSVQQLGGLCYSPVSAAFNAVCPSAFAAQGPASAWSYSALPWINGQQYVFVATAKDAAGNISNSSTTFTFAVSTGLINGAPGDGQGSASLTPPSAAGCQLLTATATYTAGPAGIAPGGAIALHVPAGWTQPQGNSLGQPGYVSVVSTGGYVVQFNPASLGNTTLGTNWIVYVATTSMTPGQTVQFAYQGYPAQGASAQGPQIFAFDSRGAGNGNLVGLSSSPALNVAPGIPALLSFSPSSPLTVGLFQNSPPMQLQLWDTCGVPTVQTGSPLPIALQAVAGGATDSRAVFYSTGGAVVSSVSVPVGGALSAPFYYNTSTAGVTLEDLVATASLAASTVSVVRPVNLLVSSASITGISVDTGTPGSAITATIIENSATGAGLSAFINFTLSNPTLPWEVIVSSDPVNFSPKLADYYGTGNPGRTLTWNGLNNQTTPPQFLPPGAYHVEIIAGGGSAINTALTVVIAPAPSIYGQLTNGPGAKVTAVGPNVLSGNFAIASSTGFFQIFGLQNGTAYTVETSSSVLISSSIVTVNASVSGVVATPAGTNAGSLTFLLPSALDVSAALPFPAPADISGTVSVHDASYAHTGSGTIHFFAGATSSDNGAQAFGVNASSWTALSLSTGTYEVDVTLPALGISTSVLGVAVNNGAPTFLAIALQKLVNVYGYAVLPAPVAAATWVSVTAQNKNGSSAVGGVEVPVAASSAVYSLFGLAPGSWTVTAVSQGELPASANFFVSGSADIGTAAAGGLNLTLKAAGVLTGTLTVAGDTSRVNMSATCPNGAALCVPVTGLDPANFFNGTVTVVLATSTTQTSSTFSFTGVPDGLYSVSAELNGFTGQGQNVNVVSGSGAGNLILTANGSKCLVTVNLPAGSHPASDFKSVSLGCAGSQGASLSFADMTAGTTIQYFASSATVQLSGLNADLYQFQAFNAATGMYRTVSASLASNSSASVLLDLSGPTYAVGGSFSLGANLSLPNNAGLSVSVSSVPGLLANTGALNYCLLGYGAPPLISAAHLELLPASAAGAFLSGPLQTAGSGCPANLINPVGAAGPVVPNPYLAYVATIAVNGSFAFPGVPPGVYLLRNNGQLDAAGDQIPQFSQTVVVTGTVAGLVFQAGSGSTISGSVLAQAGVALSRSMNVNLMNASGKLMASAPVIFNNSSAASFSFPQVVNGNYTLVLQDSAYPKAYAAAPLAVQLSGQNLSGQNISVVPSGTIKCRVVVQEPSSSGGLQSMLISQPNAGLLPATFQIQASADPWFAGGLGSALGPNDSLTPVLDANGEFVIDGLLPGTYDVKFAAPGGGAGTVSLVNSAVPGIVVTAGNVTDIGFVNLGGGIQLAGVVTDASTRLPVPNIRVHAVSSQRGSGVTTAAVDAVTDGSGRYVLAGLNPTVRFYDVYAAYRGVEVQGESLPPYQLTISPSVDLSTVTVLNFSLAPAGYSVTGRVAAPAGGPALGVSAAGGLSAQGALIYLQKSGVIPVSNPIADIQFQTDYNGNFTIPSVTTGTYLMIATSLGYASLNQVVTISTASVNVGVLTMAQGATLTGTLTNPDGSNPSQAQVSQVLAVTPDLSNILVGSLTTNPNTRTATAYAIAGFKTGLSYRVILLDSQNDMVAPPEAAGVVFTSTGIATINIVYRAVPPLVIALADRQGSGFQLEFDMSQPLRALTPNDSNLPAILTPVSAAGTLSAFALSQDRTRLTAFYQPGVSESSFTLHLRGYCTLVNPASVDPVNPQFLSESTVTFYTGIDGLGQTNVPNLQGGDVIVQGDNGRVTLAPGSFNVAVSSSVLITLQVAGEPLTTGVAAASLSGPAARLQSLRFSPQAYPSEILAAAAAVPPSVNPLSAFYNIFLPLGVSTALSKPAQLTVAYSTGTDPTTLNLYWYNPAANAYVLTQDVTGAQPAINTANHTITLNVNHFSTYVLFQSAQAVITGGTGAGALTVDNFPNPFDLGSKTVTPLHAGTGSCSPSCVINGTMIGVSIPPSLSGDATIKIFNVAGTRVRTIDLGSVQGGNFYYQNWDGTNDSGSAVASGVYIGELKIGGQNVFFKMAIIKGSGL